MLKTPSSKQNTEPELKDHSYDGIQEYDNPLPTWWTLTFYACIAWSVLYVIGISFDLIPTYEADLKEGQAEIAAMRQRHEDAQPKIIITEEMLGAITKEETRIQSGATLFTGKCAACHGDKGQGLIGPNLTDKFWIHGGSLVDIHTIIDKGVAAKGMPPWGGILKPNELMDVVAYIDSIKGTKPAAAKAAQGSPYEPKTGEETP